MNDYSGATLNTGEGLTLTRPGLPPGKKRQASLGALTLRIIEINIIALDQKMGILTKDGVLQGALN